MSSIVYITDKQMVEYHRLNGNRTMNFWRSGTKKIKDFQTGDLLFFLAKGTERGRKREKGIVGYGRYKDMSVMSVNQMWTKFGTQNGYATKELFQEAILKVNKNKELPLKISALYLTNVVYFQEPLYLSELGIKVSNLIESYFYLDKEDPAATSKVLQQAKKIGLDTWMAMLSEEEINDNLIEEDENRHFISSTIQRLLPIYSENENKKAKKIIKYVKKESDKQGTSASYTEGSRATLLIQTKNSIELFVPLVVTTKNIKQKVQMIVGHATILKGILRERFPDYRINVIAVSENALAEEYQKMLSLSNVNYLPIESNSENNA